MLHVICQITNSLGAIYGFQDPLLKFTIFIYLFTYKDDANKSVTEKLEKEVKGNNNSFSEADIQGKSKLEFILLQFIFGNLVDSRCLLSQVEVLKRNGKHHHKTYSKDSKRESIEYACIA